MRFGLQDMMQLSQILKSLLDFNDSKSCFSDMKLCLKRLAKVTSCEDRNCTFKIRIDSNFDKDASDFLNCVQRETNIPELRPFLSYFTDELLCNVQQHACVQEAYAFAYVEQATNHLFLGIADGGRTIFGSYVKAQKYLEEIGDNEANSLYFAQKGYSTKNLPEAENRGYGLSSNSRIVVECLSGAFAIISGNALSYREANENNFYKLPDNMEWPGTLVIVEIPIINEPINLYKYIY